MHQLCFKTLYNTSGVREGRLFRDHRGKTLFYVQDRRISVIYNIGAFEMDRENSGEWSRHATVRVSVRELVDRG